MTKQEYLDQIKQERLELNIDENLSKQELYVCGVCGSLDIEEKMWVGMNTGLVTDSCKHEEYYCNCCQEKYVVHSYFLSGFIKNKLYSNLKFTLKD